MTKSANRLDQPASNPGSDSDSDSVILSGTIYKGHRYVFLTRPTGASLDKLVEMLDEFVLDPELPDFNREMASVVLNATVDQL